MMNFGPVGIAAHGGFNSPTFNLMTGLVVLALTWISYFSKNARLKTSIWAALGVTLICAVFIFAGIAQLLH